MTTYEDVVLDSGRATYPVVRRTAIGEKITCGLLKEEWRNLRRKNGQGEWEDVLKDNGKPRKQVVVTVLVKESTMPVAQGDDGYVPQRGEIVRMLLDGGAATQYIDARNKLDGQFKVGVQIAMNTTHAIRYSTNGFNELGRIDTQAELDAWYQSKANIDRKESVGKRGDMAMRDADSDPQFKAECLAAYHEKIAVVPDVMLDTPAPAGATSTTSGGDPDLW